MNFKIIIFSLTFLNLAFSFQSHFSHNKKQQKKHSNQFVIDGILSKENLVGTYEIGEECSNYSCDGYYPFNNWDEDEFYCPDSSEKAIITYNQQLETYSLSFYSHKYIRSNSIYTINFDQSLIQDDSYIQIPAVQSDKYVNIMIQPCNQVGYMSDIFCSLNFTNFQLVVSKQKYNDNQKGTYDEDCSWSLKKVSSKIDQGVLKKVENKQLQSLKSFVSQNQLLGDYEVGDECSGCDITFSEYPIQPNGFNNKFKCPESDKIARIIYNENNESYLIQLPTHNGFLKDPRTAEFQFSNINYNHEKQLIEIPVVKQKDTVIGSGKNYYQQKLTISPCYIKNKKTSRNCSGNKNQFQLSIWKYESTPFFGEPCGFTLTKIKKLK